MLTFQEMRRAAGELDDLDAPLHRPHGVQKYFAVFLANERSDLLLMFRHELTKARQDPGTCKGRGITPGGKRSPGCSDRRIHFRRRGEADGPNN